MDVAGVLGWGPAAQDGQVAVAVNGCFVSQSQFPGWKREVLDFCTHFPLLVEWRRRLVFALAHVEIPKELNSRSSKFRSNAPWGTL